MQLKNSFLFAIIFVFVYSTGCANNNNIHPVANNNTDTTGLPPVETKEANSDYKPAFAGQTRIGGVKTTTPYKVDLLADHLGRPWAIIPMPDGRLLLTEKSGFMEIHAESGALVKKITGFPAVDERGQG